MGFPDYQSYAQWRGNTFLDGQVTVPTTGLVEGPYLVNNYASVSITYVPQTGAVFLAAQFYQDEACTINTGSVGLDATSLSGIDVVIPCYGNYLRFNFVNTTGSAITVDITVLPTNTPVPKPVFNGIQSYIITGLVTSAPSNVDVYAPGVVCPGPAMLWFQPIDATGKLSVFIEGAVNSVESNKDIWGNGGPTGIITQALILPDIPITVSVTNTDGTTLHQYRLSLIVTI
jgi:hypothetical protein